VRDPFTYDEWMTAEKVCAFIAALWTLSISISFVPIYMGWHLRENATDHVELGEGCFMDLNAAYAVTSSSISFFIPGAIMLGLYGTLYSTALHHSIRKMRSDRDLEEREPVRRFSAPVRRLWRSMSMVYKDNKAAFTLGIVIGVFVTCWGPFFTFKVLNPFYPELFSILQIQIFIWLGYFNSGMNPIIYSIFNREFRKAFVKIIFAITPDRINKFMKITSTASGGYDDKPTRTTTTITTSLGHGLLMSHPLRMQKISVTVSSYDFDDRSSSVRFSV
jgi:hypothetical protein